MSLVVLIFFHYRFEKHGKNTSKHRFSIWFRDSYVFFSFLYFFPLFSHSFQFPLLLLRGKIGREITRVLLLLLELLSWFIFAMRTLNRTEYVTIKEMGKISKPRQMKKNFQPTLTNSQYIISFLWRYETSM